MNLNKKKILILGSDGYVGSVLVNYFKKKNIYKLIGIDAQWFHKSNSKKKYKDVDRKDIRHFNLRSINFIPETIIYLAAISNDPMGREFKEVTHQINFKECYNCKILKVNYYKYKKLKTVLNIVGLLLTFLIY